MSIQIQSHFRTTAWELVRQAGDRTTESGQQALEELCRQYWYPLYAFLRRRGHSKDDAADVVQGFFESILRREGMARVEQRQGRFRSWLLTSLKNYQADEHRKAQTLKRGGDRVLVSLDADEAERRYQLEPIDDVAPEAAFGRHWVLGILERARDALETEYAKRNRTDVFRALEPELYTGDRPDGDAVRALGLSQVALRVARHRLRKRYAEEIRAAARATLGEGLDEEEELHLLLQAVQPSSPRTDSRL
ncbi:MAG: sigma factor [Planctomycetota bacterium]